MRTVNFRSHIVSGFLMVFERCPSQVFWNQRKHLGRFCGASRVAQRQT